MQLSSLPVLILVLCPSISVTMILLILFSPHTFCSCGGINILIRGVNSRLLSWSNLSLILLQKSSIFSNLNNSILQYSIYYILQLNCLCLLTLSLLGYLKTRICWGRGVNLTPPRSKSHVLCPNMTNDTSLESSCALLL